MDLGPHFRAKLAHLGTKLAIKAPLEALLGALGRLFGSKRLPRRPPEAPRPSQTSIFYDFRTIFERIFIKISCMFGGLKASRAGLQRSRSARWRLCARSALDIILKCTI